MDEVTSTETSPSSNQEVPNDESPLWQYVTKVEKPWLLVINGLLIGRMMLEKLKR